MKTTTRTIATTFSLVGLLAGVLTAGTAWGQAAPAPAPAQGAAPAQSAAPAQPSAAA